MYNIVCIHPTLSLEWAIARCHMIDSQSVKNEESKMLFCNEVTFVENTSKSSYSKQLSIPYLEYFKMLFFSPGQLMIYCYDMTTTLDILNLIEECQPCRLVEVRVNVKENYVALKIDLGASCFFNERFRVVKHLK